MSKQTASPQLEIGRLNYLQVIQSVPYGILLDGYDQGEILLPFADLPDADLESGDWLDVFIHTDSEDRLIATTKTPKIMVGEAAILEVVSVNDIGAFLDWGLGKDLLLPFSEQAGRPRKGANCAVVAYVDKHSHRVVASMKLNKVLAEEVQGYKANQEIGILVCSKSELGYKCVVDGAYLGLLHHGDVFQPIEIGDKLTAFVKNIRQDQRIDICLSDPTKRIKDTLEQQILDYIHHHGGEAGIGDKTAPEEIYELFQCSKKNFKRALSSLYKKRLILIEGNSIKRS